MKKLRPIYLCFILSMVTIFFVMSCKKDKVGGGPPSITRVRTVYKNVTDSNVVHPITLDSNLIYSQPGVMTYDSTVTDGKVGTVYAVIGNNLASTTSVLLNGVSIYYNPALLSNTSLQFSIPATVPYSSSTTANILTIINPYGKAEFPFVIQQPGPVITTVDQLAGNPGDVLTISGTTFNGLTDVLIGKVKATVLTSSPTLLTVKVPNGVTSGQISVATAATLGGGTGVGPVISGGTTLGATQSIHSTTATFGFSTPIFEDFFENNWSDYGWSNTPAVDNSVKKRGSSSIKVTYGGGYDAFVLQPGTAPINANTMFKFAIYGATGTTGKYIHIALNYNFNISVQVTLTAGKWTYYEIPISAWTDANNTAPTSLNAVIFQEGSGSATSFNLDDVGLTEITH